MHSGYRELKLKSNCVSQQWVLCTSARQAHSPWSQRSTLARRSQTWYMSRRRTGQGGSRLRGWYMKERRDVTHEWMQQRTRPDRSGATWLGGLRLDTCQGEEQVKEASGCVADTWRWEIERSAWINVKHGWIAWMKWHTKECSAWMNVTHEGMQRIKAWRRGVAQCMNNGSHETETGGETHLIRAHATMLGSLPNRSRLSKSTWWWRIENLMQFLGTCAQDIITRQLCSYY